MKLVLFILITLSSHLYAKELNILWWNVGANGYSDDLGDYTTLDETIASKDFSLYDVVAFGEFIENRFHGPSLDNLKKVFPYQKQLSYNKTSKQKIFILSKFPFTGVTQEIDWVDKSLNSSQINQYREEARILYKNRVTNFTRSYNRLTMDIAQKKYHFIFYHFNNPWPALNEVRGKYLTAAEILLGLKNPLMHQIQNFYHALKNDLGKRYREKNVIIMGDSNCPYSVKGLRSACIKRMRNHLPLILDHAKDYTFPSPFYRNASSHPQVKIDQAQVSDAIEKKDLEVLQWEGSDHLPIHLTVY